MTPLLFLALWFLASLLFGALICLLVRGNDAKAESRGNISRRLSEFEWQRIHRDRSEPPLQGPRPPWAKYPGRRFCDPRPDHGRAT